MESKNKNSYFITNFRHIPNDFKGKVFVGVLSTNTMTGCPFDITGCVREHPFKIENRVIHPAYRGLHSSK